MRKKIFTILLALVASVGMMNAKVTWNSSNIIDLYVFSSPSFSQSYSKEGITLSSNAEMVDAYWMSAGLEFHTNATGGFTFSNTLSKNFTKIEMFPNDFPGWDNANLGSGWSFSWDYVNNITTVTWTGNASTVDLLKDESHFTGDYVKSIVFYFEGDSQEPDPTYTVALKAGTANANKVTLSATSAIEGATITVTPDEEYEITAFKAKYNTTEEAASTLNTATGAYSFTMPAFAVTIEATIALKPVPEGDIYAGFTATAGAGGFTNEGSANLVDNKFTSGTEQVNWTKWCANDGHKSVPTGESESCWWIDFEASEALNPTGYILTTGNDTGSEHGRNPKNWVLKAKLNAGDAWTTIATVTNDATMKNKSFKDYKFFVDQSGTYQYFRFEVFANQGANVMQLCELRLIGTEPTSTSSETAAIFVYNYDCQRNPPYPQAGSPCNLSGFSDPLVGYKGIGPGVGNKALGPWKLEFVGYYTPSNHYGCEYRVISAVNSYYPTLSDEAKQAKCLEVPIFRLWQYNLAAKEYQHASYGIICAYAAEANAQDHGALFISSESWGCFLTGHQHTSSFQISCENDLTTGMADLVAAASINDPDLDAVLPVIVSIDAIGDVELTQFCKDQIEGSRAAYNALTDEQKAQVTNYSTLTNAETQWAALAAAAQPYADAVIDLINAIPNPVVYTQDCKDKIDAAQAAYDALTDGQKILVTNAETLLQAPVAFINAAPYVHILFTANNQERKVENVTFPKEFTEAEMTTILKELYGVEGDYDMYANSNADAVNISYGNWTISPFMGEVNVNGGLYKFDPQTGFDQIDFSLEISLELPPLDLTPTPTPAVVIGDPNNVSEVETFLTNYNGQTIDELIIDRPVYNNMYNTLCLPFDMNAAQIAASSLNGVEIREFTGASVEGTTLNLSVGDPVNAVVAGRPYFVKYSAATQLDDLHFEGVTINNALLDNMAVTFDGVTFKGTFTPFVMPNGLNFQGGYLFLGQNNQLFWPGTSNPLKPFRAYFYVNVESSTPGNAPKYRGMPARIVEGKNVATGVENAQSANQSTKVIVNGQLIIIKNDVRYNAQGQIVK